MSKPEDLNQLVKALKLDIRRANERIDALAMTDVYRKESIENIQKALERINKTPKTQGRNA